MKTQKIFALFISFLIILISREALAGNTLTSNERLNRGQSITSENGNYVLEMRADGLLYLHDINGAVRWVGGAGGDFLVMQSDGNLVEYNANSVPIWDAGLGGCCPGEIPTLRVTNEGDLRIDMFNGESTQGAWILGTYTRIYTANTLFSEQKLNLGQSLVSYNGQWIFALRSDGRVEFTRIDGKHTYIFAYGASYVVMQEDGNLVAYDSGGTALWNTGTWNCCSGSMVAFKVSETGDLYVSKISSQTNSEVVWSRPMVTLAPALPITTVPIEPTRNGIVPLSPPGPAPTAPPLWRAPETTTGLNYPPRG